MIGPYFDGVDRFKTRLLHGGIGCLAAAPSLVHAAHQARRYPLSAAFMPFTMTKRPASFSTARNMFIEGNAYAIATLVDRQVDFVFLANAFHGVPDKPRLARAVSSHCEGACRQYRWQ